MKKYYLLFIAIFFISHLCSAQDSSAVKAPDEKSGKFRHYVHAGFNFGALTPIGLPNTIREIKSYKPAFGPSFGYEINYKFNDRWFLGTGVEFDIKGMDVADSVIYFHTLITVHSGSQTGEFEGDFSGTNNTRVKNSYLSLPVYAVYQAGKSWRLKLGMYFAWLLDPSFSGSVSNGYIRNGNSLGEKVLIESAGFDFSKIERTFDFGVLAGAEWGFARNFALTGNLKWGLKPIFPSDFKGMDFAMYNVFFTLGVSYRLFNW